MIRKQGLKLSKKQLEILIALCRFSQRHQHVPSVRELAADVGRSATTVYQHLKALEKKGYLQSDGTAHGWQVLDHMIPSEVELALTPPPESANASEGSDDVRAVPIRGSIAAGLPIEAIDNPDEHFPVSRSLARSSKTYALRVSGRSMEDDHILDGDIIFVEPCDTVSDGTIAVALLEDGTATLKRVYREESRIRLQPANSEMDPIYVDQVRIQGRIVGVIRPL